MVFYICNIKRVTNLKYRLCECLWEENSGKENERKDDQKAESSICGCGSNACAGDNYVLHIFDEKSAYRQYT